LEHKLTKQRWNKLSDCVYPTCDADEALPVWIVANGEVIEAWYRNPSMDDCWFESDTGSVIEADLWLEHSAEKPALPATESVQASAEEIDIMTSCNCGGQCPDCEHALAQLAQQ
jgi:hypothetical protein